VVRRLPRSLRFLVECLPEALSLLVAIRHLASLSSMSRWQLARGATRLSCAGSYHCGPLSNARFDGAAPPVRAPDLDPRSCRSLRTGVGARTGALATIGHVTIQRMEHVGIVVDDLAAATAFFSELGLELQGTTAAEGAWVDRVIGLEGAQVDVAMMQTPDGHGRLELAQFRAPLFTGGEQSAPANAWGIRHVAFTVDDIEAVVERLCAHGGALVGEIESFEGIFRLCYLRGPAGIIVELAERIG
jgi:catechol 2,3-dioxygenase-like lactoylglutathione lyase family enzyme